MGNFSGSQPAKIGIHFRTLAYSNRTLTARSSLDVSCNSVSWSCNSQSNFVMCCCVETCHSVESPCRLFEARLRMVRLPIMLQLNGMCPVMELPCTLNSFSLRQAQCGSLNELPSVQTTISNTSLRTEEGSSEVRSCTRDAWADHHGI